jgi:hypothetical protein
MVSTSLPSLPYRFPVAISMVPSRGNNWFCCLIFDRDDVCNLVLCVAALSFDYTTHIHSSQMLSCICFATDSCFSIRRFFFPPSQGMEFGKLVAHGILHQFMQAYCGRDESLLQATISNDSFSNLSNAISETIRGSAHHVLDKRKSSDKFFFFFFYCCDCFCSAYRSSHMNITMSVLIFSPSTVQEMSGVMVALLTSGDEITHMTRQVDKIGTLANIQALLSATGDISTCLLVCFLFYSFACVCCACSCSAS